MPFSLHLLQISLVLLLSCTQYKPDNAWLQDHVTSLGTNQEHTLWQVNTMKPDCLARHDTDSTHMYTVYNMATYNKPPQKSWSGSEPSNSYQVCSDNILSLKVFLNLTRKKYPSHLTKPSKPLLFFLLLIIAQSNDIETNPGPSNDSTKYMCGTCDNTVT